ncbi:MAG: hypothetical protein R3224_01400 [Balneolaceae bacterium]|nr:hypothetical protein [Balneolaceae bacterium]
MIIIRRIAGFAILLFYLLSSPAFAQFEEPEFEKVPNDPQQQAEFMQQRFSDIKWSGQGLNQSTRIDTVQTNEIRARLQAVFGDPTKKLEDLINEEGFRPGKAIQFEYWFTVDDSIPMMVLDVDGPFNRSLTYVGASRYIDLMPQIKRTFSQKLMEVEQPAEYQDYFYSPEREQWFDVRYTNGEYITREIDAPEGMTIEYDY